MLRPIAIAVVVAALAAGCASSDDSGSASTTAAGTTAAGTTAAGTTAGGESSGTLDWTPCKTQRKFECATLQVPLDYGNPSGEKISLALIRQPATDPSKRIGSLLTNPGGPGGSGIDFLPSLATLVEPTISEHFDLVSFDPRGVGQSDGLVCATDAQKDAYAALDAVPEPSEIPEVDAFNKQFSATCAQKYGDALAHFGTVDAARDMDQIRQAVGDDKLSYLGFSYGTRLGSVYAQLFPDKVRAMVLDGAQDPNSSSADEDAIQAKGFDSAFDAFVADCDANPRCPAGPDAAGLVDELFKRVETNPIPARTDTRQLTEGWLTAGVLYALYAKELWDPLALGLRQAQQGDGSLLLRVADVLSGRQPDGTWDNLWEANSAVNCLDSPSRETVPQIEAEATDLAKVSPRFGPLIAWGNLSCTYWPAKAEPIPVATAVGAPPIVVIGTTRDPATPYVWAERMASSLSSGVLITRDGDGHGGYADSPCVAQMANDYLVNLTVPPPKAFCAS
ncbi:MAG TPA: alpha/beta hydrolase [Acidimicrobiales bacterium]|nr:alpha/beta hydrolase [Acidimicrobiales bacterium]